MGEIRNTAFQLSVDPPLKVDFEASHVTLDGGLISVRKLEERLGFGELVEKHQWKSWISDVRARYDLRLEL